jgi:tetratricopeptide (TPR) repeat protein
LWYNQETEGVRTDARVCNLSYLQTDWYIDQMKRPAYNSPAVPISWPRLDYCSGTNEYVEVQPSLKQQVLDFYKQNPDAAKAQFGDNPFELKNIMKYWVRAKGDMHVIPTDTVYVTIDKDAVRKSGMMMASDSIPDRMVISLAGKTALYKNDLMMLEMISQCNWTRPLYVAITVGEENFMNLGDNFVQEGLANRITPFTTNKPGAKNFDTDKTYNNMMFRYRYGGLDKPGLYIDETVMRMCYTHRRLFGQLALHLIAEQKNDKARKVLAKAARELPTYNIPMNYMSGGTDIAKAYALLGMKKEALQCINEVWKNASQYANYYLGLTGIRFQQSNRDAMIQFSIMQQTADVTRLVDSKLAAQQTATLNKLYQRYVGMGGQQMQN